MGSMDDSVGPACTSSHVVYTHILIWYQHRSMHIHRNEWECMNINEERTWTWRWYCVALPQSLYFSGPLFSYFVNGLS